MMIKIYQPTLEQTSDGSRLMFNVDGQIFPPSLWFEYNNNMVNPSTALDAALIGLLMPSMLAGEDLYLVGSVSQKLFQNLPNTQKLLQKFMPSLKIIEIKATNIITEESVLTGQSATGFSGGIDSYATIQHLLNDPNQPLDLLVFNNIGSHGQGENAVNLFHQRFNNLCAGAKSIGLPFIKINSNLSCFYKKPLYFIKTYSLRNVAALLTLQGSVSTYHYASAFQSSDQILGTEYGIGLLDESLLPMIETEQLKVIPSGSQWTRVEKTKRVSEFEPSWENLDVCVRPQYTQSFKNCSACTKCLRTALTLDLFHALEHYSSVFDLDRIKRYKAIHHAYVMTSKYPLDKEIQDLIKHKKISLKQIRATHNRLPLFHPTMHYASSQLMKWMQKAGI